MDMFRNASFDFNQLSILPKFAHVYSVLPNKNFSLRYWTSISCTNNMIWCFAVKQFISSTQQMFWILVNKEW